jgi:hypothetical protein
MEDSLSNHNQIVHPSLHMLHVQSTVHTAILVAALKAVLRIRIHRIHMFLGLQDLDPDPLVRGMDPDPSIIMQK